MKPKCFCRSETPGTWDANTKNVLFAQRDFQESGLTNILTIILTIIKPTSLTQHNSNPTLLTMINPLLTIIIHIRLTIINQY